MYFDAAEIENLRTVFNKEHPKEAIPPGGPRATWNALRKRFHKMCDSAACVVTSMLKPVKAPDSWKSKPDEWLSSVDIENVEKEYMRLFENYYCAGIVPIDFDKKSGTGSCLVSSLCSMDLKALYKKGYTEIGIVFNTDVSTGPGQHWVALFCDINPENEYPRITYFDSYAKAPEPQIQVLMARWKDRWDSLGVHAKPMEMTYNKTRHQIQDTECGMYCLYFHLCCVLGLPMEKRIPDETVRGLRGVLFRVGKK